MKKLKLGESLVISAGGTFYQIYDSKTGELVKSFKGDNVQMTNNKYEALSYSKVENAHKKLHEIKSALPEWITKNLGITER